ncbi:uncharacterized protein LOC141528031 isoform X1 [Cotesia typhae]|uniref:uncharacterized protein LOC141528031 isoform X1 n=1 Tax=Cotesia typhae TaxID=2053667 RepID=UPI003D682F38
MCYLMDVLLSNVECIGSITTIGGVSFDAEQYTNVLMASTMKMRAGRVMNVMWTNDQMKKLYISELKAKGEFSKVTTRDISKIKGICRHLQKSISFRLGQVQQMILIKTLKIGSVIS